MIVNNCPIIRNYGIQALHKTQKTEKNETENKNITHSIYNIPFKGLYSNQANYVDARVRKYDIGMIPNQKYLVDYNTVLRLCNTEINLNTPDMQKELNKLGDKQTLVIGRGGFFGAYLPDNVSRRHLELSKDAKGNIYAQDLNSKNGTVILKNTETINENAQPFQLKAGVKYAVPQNGVVKVDDEKLPLAENPKTANMQNNAWLLVGRKGHGNNIEYDNPCVSARHLLVEKINDEYILTDLNSTNGTFWAGLQDKPQIDLTRTQEIAKLQPNMATMIPDDCQICLGEGLVIDLRNQNINRLFDGKDKITIGRSYDSDLVVQGFHGTVSSKHLTLEKRSGYYIAQDTSSLNGTKIIPKNKAVPFYSGVENIEFSQGNTGDCYLLSSIYALSRNKEGQKMLKNMVHLDKSGNFVVTFKNKAPIIIRPDELDGQTVNGEAKRSVTGNLGVRAIERAYGKMIKQAEPINNSDLTMMVLDKGGYMAEAIENMTGLNSTTTNPIYNPEETIQLLETVAAKRNKYLVTVGTRTVSKEQAANFPFVQRHAYAVGKIDKKAQTIEIINPHDTRKKQVINWEDLTKYFNLLSVTDTKSQSAHFPKSRFLQGRQF